MALPPMVLAPWSMVFAHGIAPDVWTPAVATIGTPTAAPWAARVRVREIVPFIGSAKVTPELRTQRYRARLDRIGVEHVADALRAHHERHGRHPLVVIARPDDAATLTGWLHERTGVELPEAVGLDRLSVRLSTLGAYW